jgi:hypothetical protein
MNGNRTGALLGALLATAAAGRAQAANLWISEVFYDAVGSDDGLGFVELWGTPGLSLDGWLVEGVNGADGAAGPLLALSGSVPADGFFVLADSLSGTTSVANADQLLNFDLQNGPDAVVLRDASGAIADALGYGVFGATDVFAGEGSAAVDPIAGQSVARRFANVDTGDNAADFVALEVPTPGTGPLLAPEPSAGLALGLGLAALAALRRRAAP